MTAATVGVVSAPYWNFSMDRVSSIGPPWVGALFWLTMGVAGLLGGAVGGAIRRHGLAHVTTATATLATAGHALMTLPHANLALALTSAAAFGATFMGLTGICVVWASEIYREAPVRGVTAAFFALGVGQTLGAPLAGALASRAGLTPVFAVAAGLCLLAWGTALPGVRDRWFVTADPPRTPSHN